MAVEIREEQIELLTYIWGAPDPNPPFQRTGSWSIYPYPLLDDIGEEARPVIYRALVVENEYLRVIALPELGGRLYSAVYKPTGAEMFYRNQVVKPGLIALRGAWISGGIEWNFPRGHTVTTISPVDARLVEEKDGAATIWVGNIEQIYRMSWSVGIRLRPGSSAIETEIHLANRTALPHPYYFWANAAVPARKDMRMIYPGTRVRTLGATYDWPVHEGRELACYTAFNQANDVFLLDSLEDFFGVYYPEQDFGLVHVADVHQSFGKKFFTWGTAEHGQMWSAALSDDDGPYCEIQSGRFVDQQTWRMLPPHHRAHWLEWWYPVSGAGGFNWASKEVAIKLARQEAKVECTAIVTSPMPLARAIIMAEGRILKEVVTDLAPERPLRMEISYSGQPVTFIICEKTGREVIRYTEQQQPRTIELRESPEESEASISALLRKAIHAEERAEPDNAWQLYEKALMLDPACDEAALALGRIAIEHKPKQTIPRLQDVAAARPENAAAAYYLGVALMRAAREEEAETELWRAAQSPEFAHAARVQLGLLAMRRGEWSAAANLFRDSLKFGAEDGHARGFLAAAARKAKRFEEAKQHLNFARENYTDRLIYAEEHFLASEMEKPRIAARKLNELTQLMPLESDPWLELALDYVGAGLWEEVKQLLTWTVARIPADKHSPLHYYLLAYTHEQVGLYDQAAKTRARAASLSPEFVFTHHWEMETVLKSALDKNPSEARAHFYLGELYYGQGRKEEALAEWIAAANKGDDFAVLHRNLALAYQEVENNLFKAQEELQKAIALNPSDKRLYLELNEVLVKLGASPEARLASLDSAPVGVKRRGAIAAQQALCCLELAQWDRAIELLTTHTFHRWELEFRMRSIYVEAYLGRGIERFDSNDIAGARHDFEQALEYPTNLRIGRPVQTSDARARWCAGVASELMGDLSTAHAHWEAAAAEEWHPLDKELAVFRALSLTKLRRNEEAKALFTQIIELAQQNARLEPEKEEPHFFLGLALKAAGRAQESEAALRHTLELNPRLRQAKRLLTASVIL